MFFQKCDPDSKPTTFKQLGQKPPLGCDYYKKNKKTKKQTKQKTQTKNPTQNKPQPQSP